MDDLTNYLSKHGFKLVDARIYKQFGWGDAFYIKLKKNKSYSVNNYLIKIFLTITNFIQFFGYMSSITFVPCAGPNQTFG